MQILSKIIEWIPGCSPCLPKTWQEVGIQAATCALRWLLFAGTAIVLYKLGAVLF